MPVPNAPTKEFERAQNWYQLMVNRAVRDDEGRLVFTGHFQRLAADELHTSPPAFHRMRKTMLELGCLKLVQRGASNRPSIVVLCHPPDWTKWREQRARESVSQSRVEFRRGQLPTRVDAQEGELAELKRIVQKLNVTLTGLTERVARLEEG